MNSAVAEGESRRGLVELVWERLASDEAVRSEVGELILAAFESDEALVGTLAAEPTESLPEAADEPARHTGMFLQRIMVRGFRGIGPEASLPVVPGPGLTLVMGRNGSGKSSFAEAAELVLTGTSTRWEGRTAAWQEGWRNLHQPEHCRVELDLLTDGQAGGFTVRRHWGADDELDGGRWTEQASGQPVRTFDSEAWRRSLQVYRPFLSYSELGSLMDGKPSELHDALHRLLGLDDLTAAQERIVAQRKQRDGEAKEVGRGQRELALRLRGVDDERARAAAELLGHRTVDLTAVAQLALGSDTDVSVLGQLRALVSLTVPSRQDVERSCAEARAAVDALAELSTQQSQADDRVLGLLRSALEHYRSCGEGDCPVCGHGRLDEHWARRAVEQVDVLDDRVAALREGQSRLARAEQAVRDLVTPVPDVLHTADTGVDTAAARMAWTDWSNAAQVYGPAKLAERITAAHGPIRDALAAVQEEAHAELNRRGEMWAPLARELSTWHDQAHRVQEEAATLDHLRAAEAWLKSAAAHLRDERIKPFAAQSQQVWQRLRQQSNVDLGTVRLAGSATRRHVSLDVTVDDVPGAALAVMSQGELHALGLSLFLPRATVADSPFRFVMIDDPVQAMDPAKVDGLARVLADVAQERQVVVFTHDERLAESVRRMRIDATIYEVHRRENSTVEVRVSSDPVTRYLDDARALAASAEMPEELRNELVATCCRTALEAASHRKVRAAWLAQGDDHAEVEARLANAQKTHQKVALAVFSEPGRESELLARLNREGRWAADTLQACKQGAHRAIKGDLRELINNTERLTKWLVR